MKTKPAITQNVLNDLVFVLLLLMIFIMASRTPVDSDLWWHLRAGQATINQGHPLLIDIFSYTHAGENWINHSWLGQVILYWSYILGGYYGLGLLVAASVTLGMWFIIRQMTGSIFLKAFISVLAAIVAAPVWMPRPQIFSFLLMSVTSFILFNFKWRKGDHLWVLIPIFILWSNIHGGYVLGFLLLFGMMAGEIINRVLLFHGDNEIPRKGLIKLALATLGCILAVLINPNGFQTWLVPFNTVSVQALQNFIPEWASADFHQLIQQPILWMLFLLITSIGWSEKRLDGTDLVYLIGFGYMAMVARRNFGPFAIVAAPILSRHAALALTNWLSRFRIKNPGNRRFNQVNHDVPQYWVKKVINIALVGMIGLVAILKIYVVSNPILVESVVTASYPVEAVSWIKNNLPERNLFSSYNWGGYLIWTLPEYPVFIDGRTDLYGDKTINQWIQVVQADPGWNEVLDEWNVNTVLIERTWPINSVLAQSGWKLVYTDLLANIYIR